MPTFVEEVQSVPPDGVPEFRRRASTRIESVGDAVSVLESWTEESRETRTELASKYEAAKTLARDEIREANATGDDGPGDPDGRADDPDGQADDEAAAGGDADPDLDSTPDPDAIPAADLLDHPDVNEGTRQRLREYSTKLHAFLDEEQSYGEARERLRAALGAELERYQRLLADLDTGDASVRDAQASLARFARTETPGPPNATAVDVLLDARTGEESDG